MSTLQGRWLTIIEAHRADQGGPHLSDLGNQLSASLFCYALTLVVYDDDLFFYNLAHAGKTLDGYSSCPQYFEQARLAETQIEQQQHNPEPFQALLPAGHSLNELSALLNRGWWNAHDSGELDEHGVDTSHEGFVSEGERMTAFGTFLQLHGKAGEYPYAAWAESPSIFWPNFIAVRFERHS